MLVSRHPLVISSPPPARGLSLDTWVALLTLHRLSLPPGSIASLFEIYHTFGAVVVLVAEIQDALIVPTAMVTLARGAYGLARESATAFPEGYDPGVDILARLCAALDLAFPAWLIVGDGVPELGVVFDAHSEDRLKLFDFEGTMMLSDAACRSKTDVGIEDARRKCACLCLL
jgi:hypothetical protein